MTDTRHDWQIPVPETETETLPHPEERGGAAWADPLHRTRVLLVEDAPFLRYAFGRLLRMHGFEVREATDGKDALACLDEFRPHLVLTDLMMPVMDGVELIRHLHDDPRTSALPVVAITADATEQAERQAREAGAIDVITKPIDLPSLLGRLHHLNLV